MLEAWEDHLILCKLWEEAWGRAWVACTTHVVYSSNFVKPYLAQPYM